MEITKRPVLLHVNLRILPSGLSLSLRADLGLDDRQHKEAPSRVEGDLWGERIIGGIVPRSSFKMALGIMWHIIIRSPYTIIYPIFYLLEGTIHDLSLEHARCPGFQLLLSAVSYEPCEPQTNRIRKRSL